MKFLSLFLWGVHLSMHTVLEAFDIFVSLNESYFYLAIVNINEYFTFNKFFYVICHSGQAGFTTLILDVLHAYGMYLAIAPAVYF